MRLLLDTHAFLWWISDDERLPRRARAAIAGGAEVWVSIASVWEMAIKISLQKLTLAIPVERFVSEQLAVNSFSLLTIGIDDVGLVARLPSHHRDPFDRLLAAQALTDKLTIISGDAVFRQYGVKRVW